MLPANRPFPLTSLFLPAPALFHIPPILRGGTRYSLALFRHTDASALVDAGWRLPQAARAPDSQPAQPSRERLFAATLHPALTRLRPEVANRRLLLHVSIRAAREAPAGNRPGRGDSALSRFAPANALPDWPMPTGVPTGTMQRPYRIVLLRMLWRHCEARLPRLSQFEHGCRVAAAAGIRKTGPV